MLLRAGALLLLMVLVGATYQGVTTALERRQFPHPGRMVDVGGHQLHIYCTGSGMPTVVFEAPAAGMSAAWGWVQPLVAETTRACSYDRAGLGWSEAGDRPYDPVVATDELRALLDAAKEPGPYVLVGQGLGAALATIYASRNGDSVSALVLIDPPGQTAGERVGRYPRLLNASPWLARTGILRATHLLSRNAVGLPEPARGVLSAFLNRPDHLTRAARELAFWEHTAQTATAAQIRSDLRVERIEIAGPNRVAILGDRAAAEKVAAAILEVVSRRSFTRR